MPTKRILIIDPDARTAQFLTETFTKAGLESTVASSGKEGLINAYRDRPHIIILDPSVSDIDLGDLIHRIKADERTKWATLIGFGKLQDPEHIERIRSYGIASYHIKGNEGLPSLKQAVSEALENAPASVTPAPIPQENLSALPGRGKLIAFLSAKGGVGTSTMCANLAHLCHDEPEMKVAVVDLVLPIGSIATIVGYEGSKNIVEMSLIPGLESNPDYFSQNLPNIEKWRFQLLAGSPDPEQSLQLKAEQIPQILNTLKQSFDYIFVDFGRSLSRISLPILLSSDLVVMVLSVDQATVEVTCSTLHYLQNKGLTPAQLYPIINRAVGIEGLSKAEIEAEMDIPVHNVIPHFEGNVAIANNLHQPLTTKYPDATIAYSLKETIKHIKFAIHQPQNLLHGW